MLTSSSETGEPTPPTTTPCAPADAPGVLLPKTTTFGGESRTWVLYLPAGYDCTARPMVVGLHSYYGSGVRFARDEAQMLGWLDANQVIGVFPDGQTAGASGYAASVTAFNDLGSRNDDGPDGQTCADDAFPYIAYDNCGPDEVDRQCRWGTSCADDAGFVRALIEEVEASYPRGSTFLMGFSQGGQTTQSFACPLSDLLTAVVPLHGFSANGFTCAPQTPLSMLQVFGTRDNIVAAYGLPGGDGFIYDSAAETAEVWGEAQGCAAGDTVYPTVSDGIEGWTCVERAGCATAARVVTCSWDGAHVWGRNDEGDFTFDAIAEFLAPLL